MLAAMVPLCLECETACSRPEHVAAAGFSHADLAVFLDAVVDRGGAGGCLVLVAPAAARPGDELVLEAAVNGRAAAIATFNRRDFRPAADRFGLEILLPAEAVRRVA